MMDARDAYPKVAKVILRTVHQFRSLHKGDFDELLSEAHYAFMRACVSHDPDKGRSFPSWVRFCVWYQLLSLKRKQTQEATKRVNLKDVPERERTNIREMILEASREARAIADLLFDPPPCVTGGKIPLYVWNSVVDLLLEAGWAAERIVEATKELREVLK